MGDLDRLLGLRCRKCHHLRIGACRRAVHIPRVLEELGRPPQDAFASLALKLLCQGDNLVEVGVCLCPRGPFWSNIPVVEAPVVHPELLEELKVGTHPPLCHFHGRQAGVLPWPVLCWGPKGVGAVTPEGVPESNAEAQPIPHALPHYELISIVVPEGQGVGAVWAEVLDSGDAREELCRGAIAEAVPPFAGPISLSAAARPR
mmetsp:Transcript_9678/g.27668  ORF Transcript_9678/g.27668 Transcript_9678/m.27668 type:complete len:203 (+) Transcript_9678:1106-1714(+)